MNKQEKLKRLTREYFIEQKVKEISLAILILFSFIFIPFALGNSIGDNQYCKIYYGNSSSDYRISEDVDNCDGYSIIKHDVLMNWIEGIAYIFGLFVLFIVVLPIIMLPRKWIQSNWEKAEERARRDLK